MLDPARRLDEFAVVTDGQLFTICTGENKRRYNSDGHRNETVNRLWQFGWHRLASGSSRLALLSDFVGFAFLVVERYTEMNGRQSELALRAWPPLGIGRSGD